MMKSNHQNDSDDDQYYDGNNNPTFPNQQDKTILLPNIGALASTIGYENGNSDANNNDPNSIPAHYLIPCSSPGSSRPTLSINTSESGLTTLSSINQTNSLINPLTESLVTMNTNNLNPYQSSNQYSHLLVTDQGDGSRSNISFPDGSNNNNNPSLIPASSVQLNNLLNLTGVIGSQNNQFNMTPNQFSTPNVYRNSDGNQPNNILFSNGNQPDTTVQLRLQGVSLTNGNQTTEMLFPSTNGVSNLNHIIVSSPSSIGNQFLNNNSVGKIPDILTIHQNQYLAASSMPNNGSNLKSETIRVQMNSSPDVNTKKARISSTVLAAQALMDQNQSSNGHNNTNRISSSIHNKMKSEGRETTTTPSRPTRGGKSKVAKSTPVKDVQVIVEHPQTDTSNNFSGHEFGNMNTGSDSDDLSSYGCNLPPDADPSLIKLEKKRARNRVAARRCRERKLSLIQSLEAEVANLKNIMNSMREQKDRFIEVITASVNQLNRLADTMPHLRDEIGRIPLMRSDNLKFNSIPDQQHQQNSRPPHTPKRDLSQINASFDG